MSERYILFDFAERIRNKNVEESVQVTHEVLSSYGYNELFYGTMSKTPTDIVDELLLLHTVKSPWLHHYMEEEIYTSDYPVEYCFKGETQPLLTSHVHHLADTGKLAADMAQTSRREREFGYHAGVTIPLAKTGPYSCGLNLTPCLHISPREHDEMFAAHQSEIVTIAETFHAIIDRRVLALDYYKLTPREIDVLRFLAEGYRVKQISAKTGTHEDVVQRQIASARKRLNAATPIQAVAKAVALGVV